MVQSQWVININNNVYVQIIKKDRNSTCKEKKDRNKYKKQLQKIEKKVGMKYQKVNKQE